MSSAPLRVQNARKRYGRLLALADVSFVLDKPCTAIVGMNGSGKSTLIRIVVGLEKSDRPGVISNSGMRIGYLPQNPPTTRYLSAHAYVEYFARLGGADASSAGRRAHDALDWVGLVEQRNRKTSHLSGGMFRRVGLAAALVVDPDVLVLDEPTSGLDPVHRASIRRLLLDSATRTPILFASHILEDVGVLADRCIVLDQGSVKFSGSVAALAAISPNADSNLEDAFLSLVAIL